MKFDRVAVLTKYVESVWIWVTHLIQEWILSVSFIEGKDGIDLCNLLWQLITIALNNYIEITILLLYVSIYANL